MFELNKFLRLPLGISEISGANNPQWIAAAASLAGSIAGSLFGGAKARDAFLKLDVAQQIAFKQANPEIFKKFMKGE